MEKDLIEKLIKLINKNKLVKQGNKIVGENVDIVIPDKIININKSNNQIRYR